MYKLVSGLSALIRLFVLPNPFESFKNGILINIIAEPILHAITFGTVGIFYTKGEFPAGGSILYLFFYCIHVFLLILWSWLGASIVVGVIIVIAYYSFLLFIRIKIYSLD